MNASSKGRLFVVATPIGNLGDVSARALESLRCADLVLCEDTRVSRRLLDAHGVEARLSSLHEHNEQRRVAQLVRTLREGRTIALISDAGTPTISDPGRRLVAAAHKAGIPITSVPGPNAAAAALAGAGLDADRFVFEGFPPSRKAARRARFEELKRETRTIVLYEAPHRVTVTIEDLTLILGADRRACLAKELTKVNERFVHGSLKEIGRWLAGDARRCKGEFVVVVAGATGEETAGLDVAAEDLLKVLLQHLPARTASRVVAGLGGGRRNELYRKALKLSAPLD